MRSRMKPRTTFLPRPRLQPSSFPEMLALVLPKAGEKWYDTNGTRTSVDWAGRVWGRRRDALSRGCGALAAVRFGDAPAPRAPRGEGVAATVRAAPPRWMPFFRLEGVSGISAFAAAAARARGTNTRCLALFAVRGRAPAAFPQRPNAVRGSFQPHATSVENFRAAPPPYILRVGERRGASSSRAAHG